MVRQLSTIQPFDRFDERPRSRTYDKCKMTNDSTTRYTTRSSIDLPQRPLSQLARDVDRTAAVVPAESKYDRLLRALATGDTPFSQLNRVLRELEPGLVRPCKPVSIRDHGQEADMHVPMWKAGDSTAALNISNGTRAKTCSNVSRPASDGCPSGWGEMGVDRPPTFKLWGSVATRNSHTSSLSLWAKGPKMAVRLWGICCCSTGVDVPSEGVGMASTNWSQVEMFSTVIDCLQSSYA